MIGTGPFQLKSHTPSVNFILERNPDYWDKDAAMFDTIEMPVVQEYAARLSQLRAGNIYYALDANTLRAEDILTLKKTNRASCSTRSPWTRRSPERS